VALCWDASPEPDVAGYTVFYGSRPGTYDLGVKDAANTTCHRLPAPAWLNEVVAAVAAYDYSGNESARSAELRITLDRRARVYAPAVARP
jgi:hypothetical protein